MTARTALLFVAFALAATAVRAQAPTAAERLQGYALRGDTTVFVFDPVAYRVDAPERVVVTGAFRGWSADMDDAAWTLREQTTTHTTPGVWTPDVWALAVANAGFAAVAPASPFKFRVDDASGSGRWLDPAAGAPNAADGNLVFLYGVTPPRLVAELRGPTSVWVRVTGTPRALTPDYYRVVRWDGVEVPVAAVAPHEAETALLTLAEPLDPDQVHYVELGVPELLKPLRAVARFDGLWRDLRSTKPLGATVEPEVAPGVARLRPETAFRLFAPRADSVRVFLYADRSGPTSESRALARDADGVWESITEGDGHGAWYDFAVYGPDGPGSAFTNQTGRHVSDPYARVSDDSWGRSRVWVDLFAPPAPLAAGRPAMEDVVAYEVHVQDFTDLLPVADSLRGTFPAMHVAGLRNAAGAPVGIDHVERLGVNVLHLMPVQEFLHYPDSTWAAAFAGDAFLREMGIATENYQWGYRTTHALAVEGRYRARGTEPGAEREQLRDLVDAYHRRGIAVVVDLVFNHTGENMEGQDWPLTFNATDRWYAYRLDENGAHIGAFGNEVKTENRPMMQRWLLDQCRQLVEVFGVDGFRIDLAGQADEQTLRWLRASLPADLLWYGEPWIASADPDFEANPDWDWYKADAPLTFFQDDARNAFKGPTEPVADAVASRGFAGGDGSQRERTMAALANTFPEDATPNSGISYLDIHDNWALADQFATCRDAACAFDGRQGVDEAAVRIAATLLLTGLGPVVINGGTEFLRSKGLAPTSEQMGGQRVLTDMPLAPIYVNGRGDTYNLRAPNRFDWETVGRRDGPVDHAGMLTWWRNLIALRLSDAGAALRVGETAPPAGYVRFVTPADDRALGWVVGERVAVLVNAGDATVPMAVAVPDGEWRLAAVSTRDGAGVGPRQAGPGVTGRIAAEMTPQSVQVWVRR